MIFLKSIINFYLDGMLDEPQVALHAQVQHDKYRGTESKL
jgi:hypothetical protein